MCRRYTTLELSRQTQSTQKRASMRLVPSDPDVATVISRIEAGDLNLQPDFQRGEVWSKQKKQRLVDSILRDWHVPPIHVVELAESKQEEVLDGQQRLVAIRDFAKGRFAVDGTIQPTDPKIEALDGLHFDQLPLDVRRQFNKFTVRVFRIVDYQAAEPAELFFRLNQPTALTTAEQRNAFFGTVRKQIKELVEYTGKLGIDKSFLSFSNSRMAYDDVLSRVAFSLEAKSITEKITSASLVEFYRADEPISAETLDLLASCVQILAEVKQHQKLYPRFNKATLYSWLIFLARGIRASLPELSNSAWIASFMDFFVNSEVQASLGLIGGPDNSAEALSVLLPVYGDRATSRVADVSSVVLRDAVIWFACCHYRAFMEVKPIEESLPEALKFLTGVKKADDDSIAKQLIDSGWGVLS